MHPWGGRQTMLGQSWAPEPRHQHFLACGRSTACSWCKTSTYFTLQDTWESTIFSLASKILLLGNISGLFNFIPFPLSRPAPPLHSLSQRRPAFLTQEPHASKATTEVAAIATGGGTSILLRKKKQPHSKAPITKISQSCTKIP